VSNLVLSHMIEWITANKLVLNDNEIYNEVHYIFVTKKSI
jgi:hypothetical protein